MTGVGIPEGIVSFFFFFFCHIMEHVASKFLAQGSNLCPLPWEHGVLTTELPGKSLIF